MTELSADAYGRRVFYQSYPDRDYYEVRDTDGTTVLFRWTFPAPYDTEQAYAAFNSMAPFNPNA